MTMRAMSDLTDLARADVSSYLRGAADLIVEGRAGRPFILVDDEDRENEGDLVVPAQFATPDRINFMARHCRGLICLAMTSGRVERLGLPLMSQANGTRHQTAFTVSIEAREGVTTGISAHDRAHTIAVAINPESSREHIATPGHVFPLLARDGGTLVRAGHTEAAVDIARLAGLTPAGVICEIMHDDGSMARLPDLVAFAQRHNFRIGTIADLIGHRRRTEKLVRRVAQGPVERPGPHRWTLSVYQNMVDNSEHAVMTLGDVATPGPVAVRMHAVDLVTDTVGASDRSILPLAMAAIEAEGRGAVVMIRDTGVDALSRRVAAIGTRSRPFAFLRDYGIGAQILVDLGVRDMVLLTGHARTIVGLEGYGLTVVGQRPVPGAYAAPEFDAAPEHGRDGHDDGRDAS